VKNEQKMCSQELFEQFPKYAAFANGLCCNW